ncbi:hypothetical protein L579_4328 [Pantoea sp. AS-PWVM4]|nr:hypothetical protein L579_4328 [Pantoea sp. AS-PWVM4]
MAVDAPAVRLMAAEAEPDVTAVPFTVTVALESVVVGVTVMVETLLATDAL